MSQLLADPPQRTIPTRSRAPEIAWSRALATAAIVVILTTAVVFRIWRLGSVPGLNGDEAWSGVQALRFLHGEPIAWRTPTGNPINVFFFGPQVLLHAIARPSILLLRIIPVVSGILALLANFWLCRRAFDRETAVISTLLLAVLPINIAYSRFAWDASQSLLATLPVLYLPLIAVRYPERFARFALLAVVAIAAAVLVHPTNIFGAPLVVVAAAYTKRSDLRLFAERCTRETKLKTLLVGVAMVSIGAAWLARTSLSPICLRMFSLRDIILAGKLVLQLLSGSTIYRFISGSVDGPGRTLGDSFVDAALIDSAALIVVGVALYRFLQRLKFKEDPCDLVLASGTGLVFVGFYLVAGPQALAPHFERYAICLVAPSIVVIARGMATWSRSRSRPHATGEIWGVITVTAVLLMSFYAFYIREFAINGHGGHRAFHTGSVDPKQQAVDYILARKKANEPTWIVTDQWWTYWPAAYFAYGAPNVEVFEVGKTPKPSNVAPPITWYLLFTPTMSEPMSPEVRAELGRCDRSEWFLDSTGTPIITIFRRTAKKFPE